MASLSQRVFQGAKRVLYFTMCAGLGVASGVFISRYLPVSPFGIFYVLAIFFTAIIVHELGHVAGALLSDFRLISFAVGPLALQFGADGTKLRWTRNFKIGGLVSCVPNGSDRLLERFLRMVEAGPLASLLGGIGGIAIAQVSTAEWARWFGAWGAGSLLIFVVSVLPAKTFYTSDGSRILMLLRKTPQAERMCALLSIIAAANGGSRPREWDPRLVALCGGQPDDTSDGIIGQIVVYAFAMDRREFAKAEVHLEEAISRRAKCPPQMKTGIALDAAFFHATVSADAAKARDYWNQCNLKLVRDRYSVYMVEAAILAAEDRMQDAEQKARASIALLPHAQLRGFAIVAEDRLNEILARAAAQKNALAEHA